jgi:hypothetical protein
LARPPATEDSTIVVANALPKTRLITDLFIAHLHVKRPMRHLPRESDV